MKEYLKEYCVGCGLCKSVNDTELVVDKKGYSHPVNGNDEFFEKVCPAGGAQLKDMELSKIWGREKGVFLGWSNDPQVRQHASSGGVITAITSYLLESGKVDAIIHVTANSNDQTKTDVCISTTKEELYNRCGSRYAISNPLSMIGDIDHTKKYAFVGKPCDVTALNNYMKICNELEKVIVYKLSFFCAGLPSIDAQKNLLNRLGCDKKLSSLRYRGNGWPGYTTAIDEDGDSHQIDYGTAWGGILGRDIMKACRFCLDGIGEMADIACGDAWYITEDNKPDFSEREGRNVVIARTNAGRQLLDEVSQAGDIHIEKFDSYEDKLKIIQTYQYERKTTMKAKLFALKLFGKAAPKYPISQMNSLAKQIDLNKKYKIFTGTAKRILKGKI